MSVQNFAILMADALSVIPTGRVEESIRQSSYEKRKNAARRLIGLAAATVETISKPLATFELSVTHSRAIGEEPRRFAINSTFGFSLKVNTWGWGRGAFDNELSVSLSSVFDWFVLIMATVQLLMMGTGIQIYAYYDSIWDKTIKELLRGIGCVLRRKEKPDSLGRVVYVGVDQQSSRPDKEKIGDYL
ncbi:hypothetical protein Scep_021211 [Stephania cephalantha]|uniref:Uncharacterized protein n=1 Tax=Stephania cephalantha TaxID=152367 RepID=A0AAP0I018_9MAGN